MFTKADAGMAQEGRSIDYARPPECVVYGLLYSLFQDSSVLTWNNGCVKFVECRKNDVPNSVVEFEVARIALKRSRF